MPTGGFIQTTTLGTILVILNKFGNNGLSKTGRIWFLEVVKLIISDPDIMRVLKGDMSSKRFNKTSSALRFRVWTSWRSGSTEGSARMVSK
jgi:hypothetical protein